MTENRSFLIDPCERITAGAVGEPGDRIFLVQCAGGGEQATLMAEKEQVDALGNALLQLLDSLPPLGEEGEEPDHGDLTLTDPLEPEWRAGDMTLEYDESQDRVSILVREAVLPDDEPGAVARFGVSRAQARALAEQALAVVAAGRPRCQLCGNPIEADGTHVCPTMNGHRKYED